MESKSSLDNTPKPVRRVDTDNNYLNILDDEDLKLGDENVEITNPNHIVIGDQKIEKVLGFGKSGSIICKGVNKKSR
jgi:hypothetical protein